MWQHPLTATSPSHCCSRTPHLKAAAVLPHSPLHCFSFPAGTCFWQAAQHSPGVLAWKFEPHFTTSPHILRDRECGDQPCFKVHTCWHNHSGTRLCHCKPGAHQLRQPHPNTLTLQTPLCGTPLAVPGTFPLRQGLLLQTVAAAGCWLLVMMLGLSAVGCLRASNHGGWGTQAQQHRNESRTQPALRCQACLLQP